MAIGVNTSLQRLMSKMQDKYGEDSVMFAGDMPRRAPVSSGSLALDFAIGFGGLPSDRLIEIAGKEGCGKSTLGIIAMRNFLDHQPDRGALILDTEHKLSADWVTQLIGEERMERVMLFWPDDAEQMLGMYTDAVKTGHFSYVLLDSVAAAQTRRSADDPEKPEYGGNAAIISRFARAASTLSQKYHVLTVAINQAREDLEGYRRLITPGGTALKHACVLRIQLKKGRDTVEEKIDGEKLAIGYTIYAKVVKNQLAPPGRTAMYWFFNVPTDQYGFGIDTLDEIYRLGVLTGIITSRGAYYQHPALPKGSVQGMKKLREAILADEALRDTLVSEIMARLAEHGSEVAPLSDPEAEIEERPGDIFLRGSEPEMAQE